MSDQLIVQLKNGFSNPDILARVVEKAQQSLSNEELFSHALRTAQILQEMDVDEPTIIAGILQNTADFEFTKNELTEPIYKETAFLLKKIEQIKILCLPKKELKLKPIANWKKTFLDKQSQNLRRMFFAIAQDLRPIFAVLAKSLDEMRNLEKLCPKDLRQKKALAALEILAPLAYGLGMNEIKGEMEDIGFRWLFPEQYQWIVSLVKSQYEVKESYLESIKRKAVQELAENNIRALVAQARIKHYFSLYQKLLRYNMDISQIYDLVALRIIVEDIEQCYLALGILHKKWQALPGRVKDYISSPKANGYRALHTSVRDERDRAIEFQIKTQEMRREAEFGAAAHLSHKQKNINEKTYKNQFYWLDQLRQWQEEIKTPALIAQYLKSELFRDRVFVFTPKGDVINLVKDSCPLDFAYAIHSEIGERAESAIIDGKIAAFSQKLTTGQTIEIITNKNKTPSFDWLKIVKTARAKNKIKGFLEKTLGISFGEVKKQRLREKSAALIEKFLPKSKKGPEILIGNASGIKFKMARCCSPKQGESIAAFISQGEGACLHKTACPNLRELEAKWPERVLPAVWQI